MNGKEIMNSNSARILGSGALLVFWRHRSLAQQRRTPQKGFDTPQLAADALVKAAEANDIAALQELFGPDGKDLITTGDPVRDKSYTAAFAAKAREKMAVAVDPHDSSRATLSVGADELAASRTDREEEREMVLRFQGRPAGDPVPANRSQRTGRDPDMPGI